MSIEDAAQVDENMPPLDEVVTDEIEGEAVQVEAEAQTPTEEPAPSEAGEYVEVDNDKIQARFNKLTAEKYAEKNRADELERRLAQLETQAPTQTQTEAARPTIEQFDYDQDAYNAALIKYETTQAIEQFQARQTEAQKAQEQQRIQNAFNERVAKFTEKAPDYVEKVNGMFNTLGTAMPQHVVEAIMKKGPEVAYYLSDHLDVAAELTNMDALSSGIMIGEISAQLAVTKPKIKPSAAPDPIEPVNSSGSIPKTMEDMSMEEIYNL